MKQPAVVSFAAVSSAVLAASSAVVAADFAGIGGAVGGRRSEDETGSPPKCSIYLAPSSRSGGGVGNLAIDGGGGGGGGSAPTMGVFAGVDFAPGSQVGHPDIVVPIVDVKAQIGTRFSSSSALSSSGSSSSSFDWHWSDYVWEPRALGVPGEGVDAKAAAPGLGTLVRGSSALSAAGSGGAGVLEDAMPNVVPARATYDSAGMHRSKDPNAGSISYYHDMKTIATRPIEAGSELFTDFGMHYYSSEDGGVVVERAPSPAGAGGVFEDPDAVEGDDKYRALVNGRGDPLDDGKPNVWGMMWDHSRGAPGGLKRAVPGVLGGGNKKSLDAAAATSGGGGKNAGNHSTEWLNTHGYCLDNIYPGPSTIPSAGRGAFASRFIPAGSVVGPAPVVHVPDRTVLDIRAVREDVVGPDGDVMSIEDVVTDEVVGKQLLLNYCFGHGESSVLLCSVGAITSLINHASSSSSPSSSSSRSEQQAKPNAEIRWSGSDEMSNSSWLNMTAGQLENEKSIGLILEYVATRDIHPGEEIFVDYGREWEEAWEDHIRSWTPEVGADRYVDAESLNDMYRGAQVRTIAEQSAEPYPTNVQTSCYYDYVPDAGVEEASAVIASGGGEGGGGPERATRTVTHRWLHGMDNAGTNLRPCRILHREDDGSDGGETYVARILNCDETHHDLLIPNNDRVVVTDIPRRAIVFTNRLYTTDMHMENTFRHEMMVPDDMFPEAWRNL